MREAEDWYWLFFLFFTVTVDVDDVAIVEGKGEDQINEERRILREAINEEVSAPPTLFSFSFVSHP